MARPSGQTERQMTRGCPARLDRLARRPPVPCTPWWSSDVGASSLGRGVFAHVSEVSSRAWQPYHHIQMETASRRLVVSWSGRTCGVSSDLVLSRYVYVRLTHSRTRSQSRRRGQHSSHTRVASYTRPHRETARRTARAPAGAGLPMARASLLTHDTRPYCERKEGCHISPAPSASVTSSPTETERRRMAHTAAHISPSPRPML